MDGYFPEKSPVELPDAGPIRFRELQRPLIPGPMAQGDGGPENRIRVVRGLVLEIAENLGHLVFCDDPALYTYSVDRGE